MRQCLSKCKHGQAEGLLSIRYFDARARAGAAGRDDRDIELPSTDRARPSVRDKEWVGELENGGRIMMGGYM
jgi:hypothetical protein